MLQLQWSKQHPVYGMGNKTLLNCTHVSVWFVGIGMKFNAAFAIIQAAYKFIAWTIILLAACVPHFRNEFATNAKCFFLLIQIRLFFSWFKESAFYCISKWFQINKNTQVVVLCAFLKWMFNDFCHRESLFFIKWSLYVAAMNCVYCVCIEAPQPVNFNSIDQKRCERPGEIEINGQCTFIDSIFTSLLLLYLSSRKKVK